ncbi:glucoamylase family protein [Hymenobacter cheonanensis]|uniref:glucoamylase family protein n=1 Tax=Hymenobacter sp. CA2-7 TaxID=3063993 RepID=UPI00271413C1|nr:glucoamylase family protein [Hymenobacter sp. CA2-7]MDO7884347.1 glucoamylase family protein [Hymenobacter sp. CA2-7]
MPNFRFLRLAWLGASLLLATTACQKSVEPPAATTTPTTPTPAAPTVADPTADRALLDKVQQATLRYFYDFGHPASGMARERSTSGDVVTTGGTGFGVQALVVGASRGWLTRDQAVARTQKICDFLKQANRFHGAWPHWLNGSSGAVIPFSAQDNGGDLVETSYLVNGLLVARAYYDGSSAAETTLRQSITQLWEGVEWDWYASRGDGLLYWHWSPQYQWAMNMPIRGWNEALVTYVLALGSPTHPIAPAVYKSTWVGNGFGTPLAYEGYLLPLGPAYGGPLFFAHYSFLSLDPRRMQDQYANYWQQNVDHTLINRSYCLYTAPKAYGYYTSLWGLTASDDPDGYKAHQPTADNGTVSPTAALSSFPYAPFYSMQALRNYYGALGAQLIGDYGPRDAYNPSRNWVGQDFLAIDQGPIIDMIENYRSGLLWQLGAKVPELQAGLRQAGISAPTYATGFALAVPEAKTNRYDMLKHPDRNSYQLDVALATAGSYTLTLETTTGTVVDTPWNNQAQAAGVTTVSLGATTPTGDYTVRLTGPAGLAPITLAVTLR